MSNWGSWLCQYGVVKRENQEKQRKLEDLSDEELLIDSIHQLRD